MLAHILFLFQTILTRFLHSIQKTESHYNTDWLAQFTILPSALKTCCASGQTVDTNCRWSYNQCSERVNMATKKRGIGIRSKAPKRAKKRLADVSAPPSTPVPTPHPELGAPKLDAALDPDEVQIKGPEGGKAAAALQPESTEARSAGEAGSLQGLSDVPEADSESVDELLEEGNAFEAGIIEGVEDAPDADQGEVRTHEVPEDEVSEEYLNPEE
jgi:N utilization substance protein A